MENITHFKLSSTFESNLGGGTLTYPNTSYVEDTATLHLLYSYSEDSNDVNEYLHFEILEDNTTINVYGPEEPFAFNYHSNLNSAIQYSTNKTDWYTISTTDVTGQNYYTIDETYNAGDIIYFKYVATDTYTNKGICTFKVDKTYNIKGNIMSMLYGDDYIGKTDLTDYRYAFRAMFMGTNVVNVSETLLPATTLSYGCYSGLFCNCEKLLNSPNISTEVATKQFGLRMFMNCISLTSAPKLMATTIEYGCYGEMFWGCSSLIDVQEILPSMVLAPYCYQDMFRDCTSLVNIPKLPATELTENCYSGIFAGCAIQQLPELSATTLADGCYKSMFEGCTLLTSIPKNYLPYTILAPNCYESMFRSCTSLTSAPELPATTLTDSCYGGMFSGCTSLTSTPELPATTLAEGCYSNMFRDCTSLVNAPELPATTLTDGCYYMMFYDCTSLVTAPELHATTLTEWCYNCMFYGCIKLNNITMLATNISADSCLYNWVDGVASTGTFTKHPDITSLPTGVDGIPEGWTVVDYAA